MSALQLRLYEHHPDPCPPGGARAPSDAIDEIAASSVEVEAVARDVLLLLRVRPLLLGYIDKLGGWPNKN